MTAVPDVRIRRAGQADVAEVARFADAFDYEVLSVETRRFLDDARHHLVLGYVEDRPAGFASAVEVFHPDKRGELFLNEIAVMEEARRRGVARALIEELKQIGQETAVRQHVGPDGRGQRARDGGSIGPPGGSGTAILR